MTEGYGPCNGTRCKRLSERSLTRQPLLEARQAGVRSFCVTLHKGGADYLKYMYGPAALAVLDDVHKLPLKIADIFRKLTI